jgi:predicted nucleotidyltransferase
VNYEDIVATIIAALPDTEVIYLFGSRARAEANPRSDVDLAILTPQRIDPVARFDLQERIAARLNRDVDLVDLNAASTVMRVRVLEDGRVLYERDPSIREHFEATALSAYARLNEERRGILDDIGARGRVHG